MSFLVKKITLTFTPVESTLEQVEPQDKEDSGYLWVDRLGEPTVFDLNPEDQQITIRPEDIDW